MTLSLEWGLEYCGAKTQGSAKVNGAGLERNQSSGTMGTPNPDAVGEGVPEVGGSNFGECCGLMPGGGRRGILPVGFFLYCV